MQRSRQTSLRTEERRCGAHHCTLSEMGAYWLNYWLSFVNVSAAAPKGDWIFLVCIFCPPLVLSAPLLSLPPHLRSLAHSHTLSQPTPLLFLGRSPFLGRITVGGLSGPRVSVFVGRFSLGFSGQLGTEKLALERRLGTGRGWGRLLGNRRGRGETALG